MAPFTATSMIGFIALAGIIAIWGVVRAAQRRGGRAATITTAVSDAAILGALRLEMARRLNLIDAKRNDLLWVTDFPMFEYDQEEKRYVAVHHPFTSPKVEDLALLESDPSKARARAYDLVLNGTEIAGGTDPTLADTDGDGLSDGDEVHTYTTDPLDADTDDGGVIDGTEVLLNGTDPLDPSDDVPIIKIGERIILEGVNFETAKTTLLPSARTILDQVASSLSAYPSAEVAIHGHTDNVGGASGSKVLAVARLAINAGLSTGRIAAIVTWSARSRVCPGTSLPACVTILVTI